MPRQAARLVLGRSARANSAAKTATTIPHHPFSTTPRHFFADDNGNSNNNVNVDNNKTNDGSSSSNGSSDNTRAARSTAAASAISNLTNTSPFQAAYSLPNLTRAPPGLGRPGGNIISLKSLPQTRQPAQLGGSSERPAPGSPGYVPRFGGRSDDGRGGAQGGGGGGSGNVFRRPGSGNFAARENFSGDRRGNFGGGGGGRGRSFGPGRRGRGGGAPGRGRGGRGRGGREDGDGFPGEGGEKDERYKKNMGELLLEKNQELVPDIKDYAEVERIHGPERPFVPSVTLESLVHWGPAVATNNAFGQAGTAARSIRILGGGRQFHDHEQSFDIVDEIRWRAAGKPIVYSNLAQRVAAIKMLTPGKREKIVQKHIDDFVKALQEKHGKNWAAFAKEYDELGEAEIKRQAEAKCDASLLRLAEEVRGGSPRKGTTKEAIAKFVLMGEHPEVKIADDTHGKAAKYHATTPTYTPMDSDKFDAKLKQLVKP